MRSEDRRMIKSEKIELKPEYQSLFEALNNKISVIDERLIKKTGKSVGLKTSDEKLYKLLSAVTEKFLDDVLTSINHKNKKDIEQIDRKFKEAENDESGLSRNAAEEVSEPSQELDGHSRAHS